MVHASQFGFQTFVVLKSKFIAKCQNQNYFRFWRFTVFADAKVTALTFY